MESSLDFVFYKKKMYKIMTYSLDELRINEFITSHEDRDKVSACILPLTAAAGEDAAVTAAPGH